MMHLAAQAGAAWTPGTVVYLHGPLGAGKTTFVRGLMRSLGWIEPVRSPTFNLLQMFPTLPPVLHADLFRLAGGASLGLEDYLETHVCLIEWPDRLGDWLPPDAVWHVRIAILAEGRRVAIEPPG